MGRRAQARQTDEVGADVTRAGYAVLRTLDDAGSATMGELSRACVMDPGAAARQVQALEEQGLVDRIPGMSDRRQSVVSLTSRGRYVLAGIVDQRTRFMTEVLQGWSAQDCSMLATLVDRLVDDLGSVGSVGVGARQRTAG